MQVLKARRRLLLLELTDEFTVGETYDNVLG